MKTKTKKSGVFAALAVVLLLSAALITGCPDPLGPGGFEVRNDTPGFQPPPPGKSYLQLNFGDSNGRTIMPATATNANGFVALVVTIENSDSSSSESPITETYQTTTGTSGSTALAKLQADRFVVTANETYDVTVNAYMAFTNIANSIIAATGTNSTGAITGGITTNPVNITLATVARNGSGQGTFEWDLKYNNGTFAAVATPALTMATVEIQELDGTSVGATISLLTNPTGTRAVDSGTYRVVVTLNRGANYQDITPTYILHIYQGMTSKFEENFKPLNSLLHEVVFTNVNGTGNSSTNPVNYMHGTLLNVASTYPYTSTGLPSSFMDWYSVDGLAEDDWDTDNIVNIANHKIFRPQTLYARHAAADKANVASVSFTLENPGASIELGSVATISLDDFMTSGLALTVTGVPTGATYSWKYDGAAVGNTPTGATNTIIHNPADSSTDKYIVIGTSHPMSLEVVISGVTYSFDFTYTVTNS